MRLAPKFIVISLAIALLPLGVTGVRLLRSMDGSLRLAAEDLQQTLAQKASDRIQNQMDAVVDLLTLVRNVMPPGEKGKMLESVMNGFPLVNDLWVYDRTETERAAIHRLRARPGLQKKDWAPVKKSIAARGVFVGDVATGKEAPPQLVGVVPLTDSAMRPTGYLAARINVAVLSEILLALNFGKSGRAYLLDRRETLLASSLPDDQWKGPIPAPSEWARRAGSKGEYAGYDGNPVFGAQALLPDLGWRVVFEQPSAQALRLAGKAQRQIQTFLAGSALLSILLAGLLSGWISKPLRTFVSVIQKMKGGEFNSLIDVRSQDEVGDIARALRDAQPELEKRVRDSMLGRMSRMIGHDLRTPVVALRNALNTIITHVQNADETAVEYFKLSFSSLDWISDYVEDILTVGRDKPSVIRPCSLNDIVVHVLARLEPAAGVTVTQHLENPLPLARLDEKEVKRAVANVVKNALEAVGKAGTVAVSTHGGPSDVVLRVKDTGPGLSDEKKRRLFEEFSTKEGGSGLGLLVIKKVMDKHKGHVTFHTPPGQGTTVDLTFPLT
jgi:signal transduction histidine kinase